MFFLNSVEKKGLLRADSTCRGASVRQEVDGTSGGKPSAVPADCPAAAVPQLRRVAPSYNPLSRESRSHDSPPIRGAIFAGSGFGDLRQTEHLPLDSEVHYVQEIILRIDQHGRNVSAATRRALTRYIHPRRQRHPRTFCLLSGGPAAAPARTLCKLLWPKRPERTKGLVRQGVARETLRVKRLVGRQTGRRIA
jgi:hypothetical protein